MKTYFKVTGDFEAGVKQWQRIDSEGLENDILDAAEETAQYLLWQIQQDAAEAGDDWYQAALKGKVQKTEDDVRLVFPQEVFDLEYGNPEEGVAARRLILANVNQMMKANQNRFSRLLADRWDW